MLAGSTGISQRARSSRRSPEDVACNGWTSILRQIRAVVLLFSSPRAPAAARRTCRESGLVLGWGSAERLLTTNVCFGASAIWKPPFRSRPGFALSRTSESLGFGSESGPASFRPQRSFPARAALGTSRTRRGTAAVVALREPRYALRRLWNLLHRLARKLRGSPMRNITSSRLSAEVPSKP
jgi:hypothetical protein